MSIYDDVIKCNDGATNADGYMVPPRGMMPECARGVGSGNGSLKEINTDLAVRKGTDRPTDVTADSVVVRNLHKLDGD